MISITIKEKTLDKGKWTLKGTDSKSYTFWEKKKDGNQTKAFEQFKNYALDVGMTVEAEVKARPWTDSRGKDHISNDIMYFRGDEYGVPYVKTAQTAPQTTIKPKDGETQGDRIERKLDHLIALITEETTEEPKDDEIKPEDLPF